MEGDENETKVYFKKNQQEIQKPQQKLRKKTNYKLSVKKLIYKFFTFYIINYNYV